MWFQITEYAEVTKICFWSCQNMFCFASLKHENLLKIKQSDTNQALQIPLCQKDIGGFTDADTWIEKYSSVVFLGEHLLVHLSKFLRQTRCVVKDSLM